MVTIKSSGERVAVAPACTNAHTQKHTYRNLNKDEEISPQNFSISIRFSSFNIDWSFSPWSRKCFRYTEQVKHEYSLQK